MGLMEGYNRAQKYRAALFQINMSLYLGIYMGLMEGL
jgi:hypothetical protein